MFLNLYIHLIEFSENWDKEFQLGLTAFWIRKNIGWQEFADHASNQVGSKNLGWQKIANLNTIKVSNFQTPKFVAFKLF